MLCGCDDCGVDAIQISNTEQGIIDLRKQGDDTVIEQGECGGESVEVSVEAVEVSQLERLCLSLCLRVCWSFRRSVIGLCLLCVGDVTQWLLSQQ